MRSRWCATTAFCCGSPARVRPSTGASTPGFEFVAAAVALLASIAGVRLEA
ncbi:PGF-CTERM sorting domain-containing protein [Halobellus ordinarius]|uniref:PGF-CTERM sorting domain-containing protein n=1 Tax=Halobellus ordinarius TaxID=3075120 RepID=UPI003CE51BFC